MTYLVHLHLPKTGGQSLAAAIQRAVGTTNTCPARTDKELMSFSRRELRKFKFFSGHLSWRLLDVLGPDVETLTVLREPRQRLSSFAHQVLTLDRPKHGPIADFGTSGSGLWADLESTLLLEKSPEIGLFDNLYVRYFATGLLPTQLLGGFAEPDWVSWERRARSNLADITHVIDFKFVPFLASFLRDVLQLSIDEDMPHENEHPRETAGYEIGDSGHDTLEAAVIRRWTVSDNRFYRFAQGQQNFVSEGKVCVDVNT